MRCYRDGQSTDRYQPHAGSVGRRGAALRRPSPARARIAMGKAEKTEYAAAGPVFPAYREQYFAALFAV